MPPKYEKVCPYCGKTCKAYYPNNIFCECGAKYYLKTDTWLERKKKKENPDLVEVIRCKDCKYLYCLSAIDRQFYCRHFPKGLTGINIVEDNPYCSYGERREDGT